MTKSVQDISTEALSLQRQGLTSRQVADRVHEIGHANGFPKIDEYGSIVRGTIQLVFPTNDTIYFDGGNWRYLLGQSSHYPRFPSNHA
jgi:hypothetical protein